MTTHLFCSSWRLKGPMAEEPTENAVYFNLNSLGVIFRHLVLKEGENLHTDISYKEGDGHQYLYFRPKHTKQNIPYSLACGKNMCHSIQNRNPQKMIFY